MCRVCAVPSRPSRLHSSANWRRTSAATVGRPTPSRSQTAVGIGGAGPETVLGLLSFQREAPWWRRAGAAWCDSSGRSSGQPARACACRPGRKAPSGSSAPGSCCSGSPRPASVSRASLPAVARRMSSLEDPPAVMSRSLHTSDHTDCGRPTSLLCRWAGDLDRRDVGRWTVGLGALPFHSRSVYGWPATNRCPAGP